LVKFICAVSQHKTDECVDLLPEMMAIVLRECAQGGPSALQTFLTLCTNLKELTAPYLPTIFATAM
jgi:hypothetical protein